MWGWASRSLISSPTKRRASFVPSTVLGTGDTWSVRQTSSVSTKLTLLWRIMVGLVSQHAGQGAGLDGADVLLKDDSTTSPSRMVFSKVPCPLRGGIDAPSSESGDP